MKQNVSWRCDENPIAKILIKSDISKYFEAKFVFHLFFFLSGFTNSFSLLLFE